jgi:hypothetical protein
MLPRVLSSLKTDGECQDFGVMLARIFSPYFNRTFFQQQIHLEILEDALVRETPITLCTVFETLPFWGKYTVLTTVSVEI